MAKTASFYLSRVIKGGRLNVDGVLEALRRSPTIEGRSLAWTIIDVVEDAVVFRRKKYRYLAGRLVKFDPNAFVEVVDETTRKTRLQSEPNMQVARSLFVYLPDEAVFGHRHLWNAIRTNDFQQQIGAIVKAFHSDFFVECELQSIVDLGVFLAKLTELDDIVEFKATVSPPNPLFGVYWRNLKDYLEERRLRRLEVKEAAKRDESIPTTAPEVARRIEVGARDGAEPAPIGDAAILMAADGYGQASLTGRRNGALTVVKTSQSAIQLKLNNDVSPAELAASVVREVARLKRSRDMRH